MMTMTDFDQRAYIADYTREHYHRVPLNLRHETYDAVAAAAKKSGDSVNGWIKRAIEARLQREDGE